MVRGIAIGMAAAACMGIAGVGQPSQPADQPMSHPSVSHPSVPRPAADWPKAKAEDVSSIAAIVAAYYAATSGAPKQPRDWSRFQSLFLPEARLIAARPSVDGAGAVVLTVTDYIAQNRKYFEGSGFIDRQTASRTETFGNIAQVWSTYETRRQESDAEPYSRGIASIQLLKDGNRWWIVGVFWDYQRPDNPIPEKYQRTPKD